MSLSLTFTKRSLKLNVLVTDSFTPFGYNGIIRAKGVMPYSLFGDYLLLAYAKKVMHIDQSLHTISKNVGLFLPDQTPLNELFNKA